MELALSLGGDTPKPSSHDKLIMDNKDLGFCMGLGKRNTCEDHEDKDRKRTSKNSHERKGSSDPAVQLDLLPFSPLPLKQIPFPWLSQNLAAEPGLTNGPGGKALDMNRRPIVAEEAEDGADLSSPNSNSAVSTFQMDFSIYRNNNNNGSLLGKRDHHFEDDRGTSSASKGGGISDEDENGLARKKLRLTKDQSAFLEESFKEHNTLNPKQKLALAKQLHLRPRQVEVWFQNRRARTKLKQTELDCEYLKRCCETLTEENRRLQKELQELRALKSSQPFYMQLPATTLTMCPSCERVATTTTTTAPTVSTATTTANATATTNTTLSLAKPKLLRIFPPAQVHAPQAAS